MKKLNKVIMAGLIAGFTLVPAASIGQIGNIKVKNPINGGGGKTTETKTETTTTGTTSDNKGTSDAATTKNLGYYKVDQPTCVFSTDYGFGTPQTEFTTGENIFIRFAFPKPVGEYYAEMMGRSDVPSSGDLVLAIGRNIDDADPIIIYAKTIFTSRYSQDNVLDFTLQAGNKFFDNIDANRPEMEKKACFNSIGTMADLSLDMMWDQKIPSVQPISGEWEVFLFFKPWQSDEESEIKQVPLANGKFKYTYDAEKARADFAANMKPLAAITDDGMTSDLHKKNVGKIVFSKSEIPLTGASESALVNSFNLGDDIYTRFYMEKSLSNELRAIGAEDWHTSGGRSLAMNIYVDGQQFISMPGTKNIYKEDGAFFHFSPIDGDFSQQKSTTVHTSLSHTWGRPSDEGAEYDMIMLDFFYNAWLMSDGEHKIKIDLVFYLPPNGATPQQQYQAAFGTHKVLASGEFTLNTTAAGKLTTAKKLCNMPDIKNETQYWNKGLTKMTSATEWIKKAVDAETTVLKVVDGDEWTYNKNYYGVILSRELWGMAYLKDNKTGLYYARTINFKEENISSGGSKYATATWEWVDYDNSAKRWCKECLN